MIPKLSCTYKNTLKLTVTLISFFLFYTSLDISSLDKVVALYSRFDVIVSVTHHASLQL